DDATLTINIGLLDITAPQPPIINAIQDLSPAADLDISGKAEPGSTVTVTFPDASTATAVTNANGDWSVPNPDLNAGDVVTATAEDAAGNVSGTTTTTVTLPLNVQNDIDSIDVGEFTVVTGQPAVTQNVDVIGI